MSNSETQAQTGGAADRIGWIDAAKGLGIILVAAGHIWWRPGVAHHVIYSFHMPLFFLLAGYVFKPKPMGDYTLKSLTGIALPYVSFLLLLWGFDVGWSWWQGHAPMFRGWSAIEKLAFGGTALKGPFTVFWFAPCLLVARLVQNLVAQRFPDPLAPAWIAVALASLALGTWLGWAFKGGPLGLLTVPGALFLLWAGHALREAQLPRWVGWAAILPMIALFLSGSEMNMKFADYGVPLLTMAGAVAASLAVFRLAEWSGWAAPLGEASLVIMFVHVPVIHYFGYLMPRWAMLPTCLAVSMAVYGLARANWITGLLLLGKPRPKREQASAGADPASSPV